MILVNSVVFTS